MHKFWYVYVNACDAHACYSDLKAFDTRDEAVAFIKKQMGDLNMDGRFFRLIWGWEEEFLADSKP
jgi:hypothetical protein